MLHSNIYVMTIHVLPSDFPISRAVPLDSRRCHDFIGFFLQLCSARHLRRVYRIDHASAHITELIKVMPEPQ